MTSLTALVIAAETTLGVIVMMVAIVLLVVALVGLSLLGAAADHAADVEHERHVHRA